MGENIMRKRFTLLTILGSLAVAIIFSAVAFSRAATPSPGASGYHVIKTVPVGGEGGWDYVYVDSDGRRVYVSRGTHTMVLDAVTKRVFTFNGRGKNATAINAADGIVAGTIDLGGKPEFPVADGKGTIYVN